MFKCKCFWSPPGGCHTDESSGNSSGGGVMKIIYGNVDEDDRYLYHDEAYTAKISADELLEMLGGALFIKAKGPDGSDASCYTPWNFYELSSGGIVVALWQPNGRDYAMIEYCTKEVVSSGPM